jgi:hypothetical protein
MEVRIRPDRKDDAHKPAQGTDTGHLSGKCDDAKSGPHTLQSQNSGLAGSKDDIMNDMSTILLQRAEAHMQETTPVSPKRPKKIIFDTSPAQQ